MNIFDEEYKKLIRKIFEEGSIKEDRTGVGTKSYFGYQMRFDLSKGFPLLTLRKLHIKSLVHELLWFLESYDEKYKKFGNTNIRYLLDNSVTFWTEWPYEEYKRKTIEKYLKNDLKDSKNIKHIKVLSQKEFEDKIKKDDDFALEYGDLGPVYGKQWVNWGGYDEMVEKTNVINQTRNKTMTIVEHNGWKKVSFPGINQIKQVIDDLKNNPDSRRMIVNAWNVSDIDDALLPPCHILFQFYTNNLSFEDRLKLAEEKGFKLNTEKELDEKNIPVRKLYLQLYQRSADVYLGVPYNIASYSILLLMICKLLNFAPGDFIWTGGDTHLYKNSFDASNILLEREPFNIPNLTIKNDIKSIKDFRYEDFEISNYQAHPNIKVDVAV